MISQLDRFWRKASGCMVGELIKVIVSI